MWQKIKSLWNSDEPSITEYYKYYKHIVYSPGQRYNAYWDEDNAWTKVLMLYISKPEYGPYRVTSERRDTRKALPETTHNTWERIER